MVKRARCKTRQGAGGGRFKTRRGAASFYVVAFTTLLFAVLTISFIRLMIYETNRTMNSDLSNSAYDSALAGVEDAKVALLKYHDCLNKGYTADSSGSGESGVCGNLIKQMQNGIKNKSCDTVGLALGRIGSNGEVAIEENISASGSSASSVAMQQAYTCVKVNDTVDEYKAELNGTVRQKVVPLRASGSSVTGVRKLQIEWSWQSKSKDEKQNWLAAKTANPTAALMFDVIQTDGEFTLGQLSAQNPTGGGTDHFALFLQPHDNHNATATQVKKETVLDMSDKNDNQTIYVNCDGNFSSATSKKTCRAIIELPPTYLEGNRSTTTFLARVQNLYGLEMEFSLKMLGASGEEIPFVGVQAVVDSTGRANDLYRRVESRIDFDDLTFPYPEFELQLTGSDSTTEKNFYVTKNCWTASGGSVNDSCKDYGTLD